MNKTAVYYSLIIIILVLDLFSKTLFQLGEDYRLDSFGTHIPYLVLPLQVKTYAFLGWIRVKKKDGTTVRVDLKDAESVDMRATLKQMNIKDKHHRKNR